MVLTVFGLVMYKFVAEEVTNAFECPASPVDHPNHATYFRLGTTASMEGGGVFLLYDVRM